MKSLFLLYLSSLIGGVNPEMSRMIADKEVELYINTGIGIAKKEFLQMEETKILYFSCQKQLSSNSYLGFCFEILKKMRNEHKDNPIIRTFSQLLDEKCLQNKNHEQWMMNMLVDDDKKLTYKCLKLKKEFSQRYLYQKNGFL